MVGQIESAKYQELPDMFWGARDELSIEEGLLMKGNHICIPPELYDRSLHRVTQNAFGNRKNATQS